MKKMPIGGSWLRPIHGSSKFRYEKIIGPYGSIIPIFKEGEVGSIHLVSLIYVPA